MANGVASREKILAALPILETELGYSPTVREIAERVGLSKSATYFNLRKLVDYKRVVPPARVGVGWRLA